jgi:hypothetical protein
MSQKQKTLLYGTLELLWGNGRVEMLPSAEMDFSVFPAVRDRLRSYDARFVPG